MKCWYCMANWFRACACTKPVAHIEPVMPKGWQPKVLSFVYVRR